MVQVHELLNTKARYIRAQAAPPNFEHTQKAKMAENEENNSKRLVWPDFNSSE